MRHPQQPVKLMYNIHYRNVVCIDNLSNSCLRLKDVNFRKAIFFKGQLLTFQTCKAEFMNKLALRKVPGRKHPSVMQCQKHCPKRLKKMECDGCMYFKLATYVSSQTCSLSGPLQEFFKLWYPNRYSGYYGNKILKTQKIFKNTLFCLNYQANFYQISQKCSIVSPLSDS